MTTTTPDRTEKLIEQTGWCQGASARDHKGEPKDLFGEGACFYCIVGAITKVYTEPARLLWKIHKHIHIHFNMSASQWNDDVSRTKEEVISVLKELDI